MYSEIGLPSLPIDCTTGWAGGVGSESCVRSEATEGGIAEWTGGARDGAQAKIQARSG
jgi:hypothetical protein